MPVLPPSRLPVLALDTSTEQLAAGLHTGRDAFTCLAAGGAQASSRLLPELQALLVRAGLALADVQAVAFGQGPGAFTGLRTACAVAQGLGFGLGRRVLPLCSLLVVAEDARLQSGESDIDLTVLMDARMDEVYAGRFRHEARDQGGRWQVLNAPELLSLPALQARWGAQGSDPALQAVCGSALAAFGPRLGLPVHGPQFPHEHDRAAALLRLAVQAVEDGAGLDPAQALPLYLRDKVAQTTAERAQAKAAA
jgi:tRNA threonylcarbamoyladenosine biosynthesis protein TsaB